MESWITVNPNNGVGNSSVAITLDANPTFLKRTANINVKASILNKTLTIIQKGDIEMIFEVKVETSGIYSYYKDGVEVQHDDFFDLVNNAVSNGTPFIFYVTLESVPIRVLLSCASITSGTYTFYGFYASEDSRLYKVSVNSDDDYGFVSNTLFM